jgi:hypothetical protein
MGCKTHNFLHGTTMQRLGPSGKPFKVMPAVYEGLRVKNLIYKHARNSTTRTVAINARWGDMVWLRPDVAPVRMNTPPVSIDDIYRMLSYFTHFAGEFVWNHGNKIYTQVEFKRVIQPQLSHVFDIIMHIFTEREAKAKSLSLDDGLYYSITRGRVTGEWVTFPTQKSVVTIQKLYRGKLGRRRANQAREEYYRPGGRGYLAARNDFAARVANRAAANIRR